MKKPISLWQWVGWRMGFIAAGAVVLMSFIMWSRYYWWDIAVKSRIPTDVLPHLNSLMENPVGREEELWSYLTTYYYVGDILPGISGGDWWTVALLLLGALPIIFMTGFLLLRPLSSRVIDIAGAAKNVASGNLNVCLPVTDSMPLEIQRLTSDFNSMTSRLRQYEQEVQESSAVLAHELRTPLNAAMGRVRGILDDVFPANSEQLSLVLVQLENLNLLVNDLHLLSLAQAGQLPLAKASFTISDLLRERIEWFQPQLAAVERNVVIKNSPDRPIYADRKRIGQVLNIILDNYIRYASVGGDLLVEAQVGSQYVTLIFSDRGPGLSAEEVVRMFERFWRQERSRNRKSGGSGLGLSIAQAICSSHGGSITARRREGGGMVFELLLPWS